MESVIGYTRKKNRIHAHKHNKGKKMVEDDGNWHTGKARSSKAVWLKPNFVNKRPPG